ncbi:MAG: nucleotidyltransferase family protein [Ruminococcus sp.]|nr:nucleotidyltransferase family protein [Ruminococcus sp.]
MTYEMEYTAYLYACGATGKIAEPPKQKVDWERVVQIAVEQSITYTVAIAIKKGNTDCDENIKNRLIASLRGAAIKNALKTDGILSLVEKMENEGIKTVIIKGIDVARFYANPECRVSSDTDLFIAPEDEKGAIEFLSRQGFFMDERPEISNHAVGTHPVLGMIELHIKLLPDLYKNINITNWQVDDRAIQNREEVSYLGKKYFAMETTDNLLFLTHHMMKHLMYNGISLRMMMDNALFAKHNIEKLDRKKYEEALKETKYFYTMQLIFGAMVKYCGFLPSDFPIEPEYGEDMMAIMNDLEESGWQGKNNEAERMEAWEYYRYQTAKIKNDRSQISEINKEVNRYYRRALFLPMEYMQDKYPILKRNRWLYPFCWTHRFLTKGISRLFAGSWQDVRFQDDSSKLSEGGQKKVELLKRLELM